MGFFDEITKPFKKAGKAFKKAGKNIGFDKWGPYASILAPFLFPGAGTGIMNKIFGKKFLQSAFMKSAAGTAIKEAAMKYAMATAMGKENPHLAAKSAFFTSFPFSYMKTGGDWNQMLGKNVMTPGIPGAISDRVSIKDYEDLITPAGGLTDVTPRYTEYGQSMMDKWHGPGRGKFLPTSPYDVTTGYGTGDYLTHRVTPEWTVPKLDKDLIAPPPYSSFAELSPTYKYFPDKMEGAIPGEEVSGPLAGLDYMKREKTGANIWDTLLKKGEGDIAGIGEMEMDPWYIGKTAYDLMQAKKTEGDIAEEKRKRMEQFMADLMWRPDAPNYFDSFFLGNKGGIASLAHGGRIGYQGGGIGSEGAGPMTPMAPMDYEDDFIYNENLIGPNPSFVDEFEGYLDLVSGDPATDYTDMWREYNRQAIQAGLPTITFEEFMELRGDSDQAAADPQTLGRFPVIGGEMAAADPQTLGRFPVIGGEMAAQGGIMGYYGGGELNAIPGGMVSGPGTEVSDSIPAQLSNNEFVFTADAVRAAGGGDIDLGAQKMYGIMNALDPQSARVNEPPVYS